ncbi:MAG: hypothetical protein NTZ90_11645 [Proteobacteria bacterium]|nr:hypothetical protein [Pseudomonadota bacterium]
MAFSLASHLAVALALLFHTSAHAATADQAKKPKRAQEDGPTRRFSVGGDLGYGMGISAPAFGGDLSYRLTKQLVLNSSLTYASNSNLKTSSSPDSTFEVTKLAVSGLLGLINIRYYTGRSFYAAAGLGWRQYSGTLQGDQVSDPSNSLTITMTSQSVVAGLALGNLWTFNHGLYLGGEWLAAQFPLTSSYSSTTTTTGTLGSGQDIFEQIAQDTAAAVAKTTSVTFLTLKVGYSF